MIKIVFDNGTVSTDDALAAAVEAMGVEDIVEVVAPTGNWGGEIVIGNEEETDHDIVLYVSIDYAASQY